MITNYDQVINYFLTKKISSFNLKIQKDIQEFHQMT